jgi:hypothetical protein
MAWGKRETIVVSFWLSPIDPDVGECLYVKGLTSPRSYEIVSNSRFQYRKPQRDVILGYGN